MMRTKVWLPVLLGLALLLSGGLVASAATAESLFGTRQPTVPAAGDTAGVTVGTKFTTKVAGSVTGVRFYKGAGNGGSHVGSLYSSAGARLASATYTKETADGWQQVTFATPVRVAAGATLTAATFNPTGRYAYQHDYAWPVSSRSLTALAGVYRYGSGSLYPSTTYRGSNYFVDVLFVPQAAPAATGVPSPTPTVTSSPRPTSSPTAPSTTPSPTATATAGLSTTPVDGGTGYYGRWTSNTLPTDSTYFPVGVWMEQGFNASRLAGYGLNMIVNPVSGGSTVAGVRNVNALDDEVDMWAGPGNAAYTGGNPVCSPATSACGYTIMQQHQASVSPGEMRYANYGKGVGFWESNAEAAQFVNTYQDVTSIDLYWGTDPDLCQASQGGRILGTGADVPAAECHKAANYGRSVDRVRSLVSPAGSKPIWNYIEVGQPGSSAVGTMPVPKIKAAVWSSLIHGARGIVYFNHSFAGSCQTQHVIFDCNPAIGQAVTSINSQVKTLAPVLNSPTVNGVARTGSIDQLTKWDGRNFYVFTGSTTATAATSGSVTVPTVGTTTAEVIGESRTVPVVNGKITDTWADGNAVHLYKIL